MSLPSVRFFRRVLYSENAYYSNHIYHYSSKREKKQGQKYEKAIFHEKFGIICAEA